MLYPYKHDMKMYTIVSILIAFLVQTKELNFDCAVLRPPEAWCLWHGPLQTQRHGYWPRFDGSVCYEIPFVMDCKRWSVDSKSGKYSSSHSLVLVIFPIMSLMVDQLATLSQYVTSTSRWLGSVQCRLLRSAIGNFPGQKVTCLVISSVSLTEC